MVDAGQAGGGVDFTDLNGGGLGNGSTGGNTFLGYSNYTGAALPTVPQAILDLNTVPTGAQVGPRGAPYDLLAQDNTFVSGFSGTNYTAIEALIYHSVDNSKYNFVDYINPATTQPQLISGPSFYDTNLALETTQAPNQHSMISHVQMVFNDPVYFGTNAFPVARIASNADGVTADSYHGVVGTTMTVSFSVTTGQFVYTFSFAGAGVESSGSVEDGKYTLTVNYAAITTYAGGGQPVGTTTSVIHFYRLFGDVLGTGLTTGVTSSDLTLFMAAYNTRSTIERLPQLPRRRQQRRDQRHRLRSVPRAPEHVSPRVVTCLGNPLLRP